MENEGTKNESKSSSVMYELAARLMIVPGHNMKPIAEWC